MPINRKISIAPMMDWTDRHDRYFLRLIAPQVLLYTEMVTANAIIFGDRQKLLGFHEAEHPLALQLGGSDPVALAKAAKIGQDWGYDEVNLNCGCPSDRVQSGQFGACLMGMPQTVADCVKSMRDAVDLPVTIKTRIGIDEQDSYEFLCDFMRPIIDAGCDTFIIHARKAWLNGLSPKENREVPPLDYERAYQLKRDFPNLHISINGGVKTIADIQTHLQHVDGVMIGREAYQNPWFLHEIDQVFYGGSEKQRDQILEQLKPYIQDHLDKGGKLSNITRHILGLYNNQPGARGWRQILSEQASQKGAGVEVLAAAHEKLSVIRNID